MVAGLGASGCRAASDARKALRAERQGDYRLAYDLYCQAAEKAPSSRSAARGIRRTAHVASRYWYHRAVLALGRDDYPAAWKCLMQALMIRPDYAETALMLRDMEVNHADALADTRRAWLVHGTDALLVADEQTPSPARRPPGVQPDERVAQANRSPPIPIDQRTRTSGTDQAVAGQPSIPQPRRGGGAGSSDPGHGHTPAPRPAAPHRDRASYLNTVTVSRKDDRYTKTAETVDGIFVKVKDTDSDPDADVDIYLRRKRIRRVKNWCVGQRVTVLGISGQRYDIVLRDITHHTATIKLSIRRAR